MTYTKGPFANRMETIMHSQCKVKRNGFKTHKNARFKVLASHRVNGGDIYCPYCGEVIA